jgi:hypothetical protein
MQQFASGAVFQMTNRVPLGMVVLYNMRGTCAGLRATSVEVSGHVPRPFFASFLREVASHQPGEARGHEASQVRSAQDGSHVPPADVENGPGAEAGGGQVQHRLRHFLWFAQPSKRHSPLRQFPLLCRPRISTELACPLLHQHLDQGRPGHARRDHIHADPIGGQLLREHFGEAVGSRLGLRVRTQALCWLPGTSVPKTGRENSFCHTTTTNDSRQAYASFFNSWQFYGVRGSQTFHFSFSTSCSKEDYCSKVMGSEAARK